MGTIIFIHSILLGLLMGGNVFRYKTIKKMEADIKDLKDKVLKA